MQKINTNKQQQVIAKSFFATLALTIGIVGYGILEGQPTTAVVTGFNPGRIIEDNIFVNNKTMSINNIQLFLNSKVKTCDNWGQIGPHYDSNGKRWNNRAEYAASKGVSTPFTCLKDYSENGKSAAQIIYDISQEFSINPQVLIVLLQKEQGLITDDWPWPIQYRSATGYGCPDSTPGVCDSSYYGFTNQVTWAARMFRAIMNDSPTWYTPYILGNNHIQWSPNSSCGGSTVFIQNRATQALYNYTPYQPNQAALNADYGMGDACSAYGNRNFFLYFRDWFGYVSGPAAFKTASSPTIYLPVEGYKLAVPHGAVMQDYGISYEAVQTVDQSYVDNMPSPPAESGISTSIAHVVKSPSDSDEDGGSIYLISRGVRYQFQSMEQFFSFGFQEAEISYLPLGYLFSRNSGGALPNFVTSPIGSVFKVEVAGKRILFEYSTYIQQNPSDRVAHLSYFLTDKITSSTPFVDRPVLIQYSKGAGVTLLLNNNYYAVPDYDVFSCMGFETSLKTPVYRVPRDYYIAPITPVTSLSCVVNINGQDIALHKGQRINIDSSVGASGVPQNTDLTNLIQGMPLRNTPLKPYIKAENSSAVWAPNAGTKKVIPTYNTFLALGLNDNSIDNVNQQIVNKFSNAGILLAKGQVVKSPSHAAVSVIGIDSRLDYPTSDLYLAYKNSWSGIDTIYNPELETQYPATANVKNLLAHKQTGVSFIVANNGCFQLTDSDLTHLGTSHANISSTQPYDVDVFKNLNLNNCSSATRFLKTTTQSIVYWVDNGSKYPLHTYSAMLQKNGGKEPTIMVVDRSMLDVIPQGEPIY